MNVQESVWKSWFDVMSHSMHELYIAILQHMGACRAVWVPGQNLAMPHLMHNCGKHNSLWLFVTILYAIRTSVYAYAICWLPRVFAGPVLVIRVLVSQTRALGSGFARLGNARVCPALQAPLLQHKFHFGIPDQESFYLSVLWQLWLFILAD